MVSVGTAVRRLGGLEDAVVGGGPKKGFEGSWGQALHCPESSWHTECGLYVQEGALWRVFNRRDRA